MKSKSLKQFEEEQETWEASLEFVKCPILDPCGNGAVDYNYWHSVIPGCESWLLRFATMWKVCTERSGVWGPLTYSLLCGLTISLEIFTQLMAVLFWSAVLNEHFC